MSRILWIGTFLVLLAAAIFQVTVTIKFVETAGPAVLHTPHGLAFIPLVFNIPDGVYFLRPFSLITESSPQLKYLQALLPVYAAIFFFWITGLFFYVFSRVRRLERAYILFSIFAVGYLLLFVDFFTTQFSGHLFLAYNIIIIAPFLYLFRSVYGLSTQWWIYPLIMLAGAVGYYYFPVRSIEDELLFIKMLGGIFLLAFFYCAFLFLRAEAWLKSGERRKRLWAERIFNLSLIFFVALPPAFFFVLYYFTVRVDINYNALYFLPALFPIIFLTLSLRWGLVSFRIPISLLAVRVLYFVFFAFCYWFTIGFSFSELAQGHGHQLSHIAAIIVFVLLINPARTLLITSLDRNTSSRRKVLANFVLQSSQQIANPRRVNQFIDRLATSLTEGLGSNWAKIIMSRDLFQNWESESERIIYLPGDDPFWTQVHNRRRGRKFLILTQAFVGPVRDFLQSHGAYMLIALGKFDAGLLISERREGMPYYTEDTDFLRRIAHETETLIQNYIFLIENVKLRRRERELADNARIQRRIIPGFRQFERFSFWSYSHAYESVTGDYIDLIEVSPQRYIVLLGDVSGHGISSGYIVAFARAYLRAAFIERGESLVAALNGLNSYLAENYRGNEFITLFALELVVQEEQIQLKYVNAGQHAALLHNSDAPRSIVELGDSQRLLGVAPVEYRETSLILDNGPARILLYSDGAFDVFNKSGKILGYKKFIDWVESSLAMDAPDQLNFLRRRIETYTASGVESDDLALIIIQTL